jgi:oligopeptide/dipeptide ABC transporter ATP-binding protein
MPVLSVSDLRVSFGDVPILRGVSFELESGKTLGVVGESGCGKSMTGLALMGMVPRPGLVTGSIQFEGNEWVGQRESEWSKIRGDRIAMVMQDPFSSLNPVMRVGDQIAEVYRLHHGNSKAEAWKRAVDMLDRVGIPEPNFAAKKYPHQMSGGQRQRVVIAIAFAAHPTVLVADEPTTALDVTLQAQVLELIQDLEKEHSTAVIFISHDIGVISEVSDHIAVFYAGQIVEYGPAETVLTDPEHPYTRALLGAVPRVGVERLSAIEGQPPRFDQLPPGCAFAPRCPKRFEKCVEQPGLDLISPDHRCACWYAQLLLQKQA